MPIFLKHGFKAPCSIFIPLIGILWCFITQDSLAQNPVCGFQFKKTITVQGSRVVGGPHTNFPILISHTDPDLASAASKVTSASGFDIVFSDDSGNLLDFQLEKYDGATGQYVAWVRIPTLTNGTDVDIHILYGKASITTNQSTDAVWGANYESVWHLNDDFLDATSNTNDGTNNGSTDVVAKIADGQAFVDPNHWIESTSFPNLTTDFTMSGWAFTTDNTQAGQRIFADDANNTGGYAMSIGDPGAGRIRFYSRGVTPVILDSPVGTISNSTWHYCVAVADITNSQFLLYVDGALVASNTFTGTWGTDAGNASIGGEVAAGETANRFQGNLDEVRVAASALTANWIATEYNSQNQPILVFGASNPGDFYAIALEEDIFHTSNGNGDWDQTTTWDSGQVPDGQFENVVIADDDVDIDANSADYTICNCTLNGTGAANTRLDITSTRVLTVIGDLDASHTGTGTSTSRLFMNNSAVINVSGNMNWDRSSSNGTSRLQLLQRGTSILDLTGNLLFSMSDGNDILFDVQANSDTNIGGDFSITIDGGDDIVCNIDDASTVDIAGNLVVDHNSGDRLFLRINTQAGTDAVLTVAGDIDIDRSGGGNILIQVDDDNSIFNINQDFNITSSGGGRFDIDLDNDAIFDVDGNLAIDYSSSANGEIDFDVNAAPTLNVDGNVTITNSGNVNEFLIDLNSGTFQTDLDFTLNNSSIGTTETVAIEIDGTASMNIGGDLSANLTGGDDINIDLGTNVGSSTAQLNITGNAALIQNRSGADHVVQLLVFEDTRLEVMGNLTLTNSIANTSLTLMNLANNGQATIGGNINLNAQSAADLEIRLDDTSELQIGGNFVRQATPNNFGSLISAATAMVTYNGSAAQIIAEDAGAGVDNFTYGILEINNSSSTNPQLTMEGLATVNGGMVFLDGVVATNITDLMVIADGATTSGASDASHIDGFVRKVGNTPAADFAGNGYAFPVGDDDNYQPIFITAPAANTDQFDAQYLEVNPHPTYDNTSLDASLDHISRNEHWLLERSMGSSNVSVRLTWDGNSGGVGNLPDLSVARWDGSTWIDEGNGGTTGNITAGTVISNAAVTSFSPFTLGTTTNLNILPIELIHFTAESNGNLVDLSWSTASEESNDFFTVERAKDLGEWEVVGIIPGAGDSETVLNYKSQDRTPYLGTSFYRLKQTDFDGQFSYSPIERVFIAEDDEVSLLPIPASQYVVVSARTLLTATSIKFYNSLGQRVYPMMQALSDSKIRVATDKLANGAYHVTVITSQGISQHRLIVRN